MQHLLSLICKENIIVLLCTYIAMALIYFDCSKYGFVQSEFSSANDLSYVPVVMLPLKRSITL